MPRSAGLEPSRPAGVIDGPVFLVGASGSGKTVIAERAAASTGLELYDTDAQILVRTGEVCVSDIFEARGEQYFRHLEMESFEEVAQMGSMAIVATGGGFAGIPGMMERCNRAGTSVYLKASLETLWKRLNTDPGQLEERPLLRGGGKETLARLVEERRPSYVKASMIVETDQLSVDEVCSQLVDRLKLPEEIAGTPGSTG